MVGYEMKWTVNYFLYQSGLWVNRKVAAEKAEKRGAAGYAARKAAMWRAVAAISEKQFQAVKNDVNI